MFDILLFLFESYFDAGSYPEPNRLSAKLTAAGFEEEDINQALTWLSGLRELSNATYPEIINNSGLRCYTDFEAERMSEEGLRFIAFWEHNKIITPIEREMIIDRVIALGRDKLSVDKVKLIALMVLWNQHEDLDPMLIEDLLTPTEAAQLH
jgi:Smg protein